MPQCHGSLFNVSYNWLYDCLYAIWVCFTYGSHYNYCLDDFTPNTPSICDACTERVKEGEGIEGKSSGIELKKIECFGRWA